MCIIPVLEQVSKFSAAGLGIFSSYCTLKGIIVSLHELYSHVLAQLIIAGLAGLSGSATGWLHLVA